MKTTFMARPANITKKWFIVDAEGQTLGRLASQIAYILRGKHKPTYTPHMDDGDNVIVINAEKIKLTGSKEQTKVYYRHTGYLGGLRSANAAEVRTKHPERLLEMAIKGMLPHNVLGREVFRNLKVYVGSEHPHAAQQPQPLPERVIVKK
jgi:large subunit ribosomal protein L13